MADGTFVEAIARQVARPELVDVNGVPLVTTPNGWNIIDTRAADPGPEPLELTTLRGLAEYLERNVDAVTKADLMLHVESPTAVALFSKAEGRFYSRRAWAAANCEALTAPEYRRFGQFAEAEDFNIWLQTSFTDSEDRARVLALVGNIREDNVKSATDDGVTQTVTAKAGIHLAAEVKVPNPVRLRPYRTFREVEQPASSFVLRMRRAGNGSAPLCGLFEADGSTWKLEAMANVAAYLREHAAGVAVLF